MIQELISTSANVFFPYQYVTLVRSSNSDQWLCAKSFITIMEGRSGEQEEDLCCSG